MRDEMVAGALVVAFATLVTAHVTIVLGLAARPPRWRALVALVAPPLAPYWSFREKMRARAIAWLFGGAAYAVLRVLAAR